MRTKEATNHAETKQPPPKEAKGLPEKGVIEAKCLQSLRDLCTKDANEEFKKQVGTLCSTENLQAFLDHQVALPLRMDTLLKNLTTYRADVKALTTAVADNEKVEQLFDVVVKHLIDEIKKNFSSCVDAFFKRLSKKSCDLSYVS